MSFIIPTRAAWIILGASAVLLRCYQPDTNDLPCLSDDDCLGLKCIGQRCTDGAASGALYVAIGSTHACAILGDGSARCWGANTTGQLGYPDKPKNGCLPAPSSLGAIDLGAKAKGLDVRDIAASGHSEDFVSGYTCALLSNGRLRCWGVGSLQSKEGQPAGWLGYEDDHDVSDPSNSAEVPLGPEVRAIAAYDLYTCAIFTDGRLACWGASSKPLGAGSQKHVGDDPGEIRDLTPLAFGANLSAVKTVSTGNEHACATLADGTAWCWGVRVNLPMYGELGIGPVHEGDSTSVPNRVQFDGIDGRPLDVRTGLYHSCALLDSDAVACWGCNESAQLGLPKDHASLTQFGNCDSGGALSPVLAAGVNDTLAGRRPIQLVSGANHNCVRTGAGAVHCWGDNGFQQSGTAETTMDYDSPVEVKLGGDPLRAVQLAASANQTCAVVDTGEIVCWGDTTSGQAGRGACGPGGTPPQRVDLL